MRLVLVALAGGLSLAAYTGMGDSPDVATENVSAAVQVDGQRFLLHVNGRVSGCQLTRLNDGTSLEISAGCGEIDPPIAAATQWIKVGKGGAVVADVNGEPLLELAVSDGAAYESFGSRSSMILLAPMD